MPAEETPPRWARLLLTAGLLVVATVLAFALFRSDQLWILEGGTSVIFLALGLFAPHRVAALIGVPMATVAYSLVNCGVSSGWPNYCTSGDLNYWVHLELAIVVVLIPGLVGLGVAWLLGLRWHGRHIITRWPARSGTSPTRREAKAGH